MTGKLSGKQVQEISDAILNAYGSVDALRMMVRIELDEILDEIAVGGSIGYCAAAHGAIPAT